MVLLALSEIIVESSWWSLKKMYNGGYYIMYGNPETTEDKILHEVVQLKNLTENGETIDEIETKILINMEKQLETQQNSKNEIFKKLNEILEQITKSNNQINELQNDIIELKDEVNNLKDEINELKLYIPIPAAEVSNDIKIYKEII